MSLSEGPPAGDTFTLVQDANGALYQEKANFTTRYYGQEAAPRSWGEDVESVDRFLQAGFPSARSITGDGVRDTHRLIASVIPDLCTIEIPSGTKVLDWTVPPEWKLHKAYIKAPDGSIVVDVAWHPLHVVNYSTSFSGKVALAELQEHLYSLPSQPDAIPYITSYYARRWGFCLTQKQRDALVEGEYEVVIEADFLDAKQGGSLTLSEVVLPATEGGPNAKEVLFSCYTCHPHMANDSFSGVVSATFLYHRLSKLGTRKHSYRFVFIPETIGAIAYLSLNGRGPALQKSLIGGYVLTCIGDAGGFSYKRSRPGGIVDEAAVQHLADYYDVNGKNASMPGGRDWEKRVYPFWPSGSDERHYCSPGFNLPVGGFCRTFYGHFPHYHTSTDNLEFVTASHLHGSIDFLVTLTQRLESYVSDDKTKSLCDRLFSSSALDNAKPLAACGRDKYRCLPIHGEPQMGKRGLYHPLGGPPADREAVAMRIDSFMWLLNYCDGEHSLADIVSKGQEYWKKFNSNFTWSESKDGVNVFLFRGPEDVEDLSKHAQELVQHGILVKEN